MVREGTGCWGMHTRTCARGGEGGELTSRFRASDKLLEGDTSAGVAPVAAADCAMAALTASFALLSMAGPQASLPVSFAALPPLVGVLAAGAARCTPETGLWPVTQAP